MVDLNDLVLAVAAILFVVALAALIVWAFKTFFTGTPAAPGFMRPRDKRLGVVETASVDAKRKLFLVRRDDVEHLVMIGGPIDHADRDGNQRTPASGAAAGGRDHRQERDAARARFQQDIRISALFFG